MRRLRLAAGYLRLLFSISAVCSAQNNPAHSSSKTQQARPDGGTISGNVYINRFFDLTFEFPKDWIPHGEATKQHFMEIGKDKLVAAIPGSESAVRLAEKHTYNLLTVFENELGTPGVKFFRSEILTAEDVSWAPGIKTGEDYLLNVLPLLKKEGYDRFSEIKQIEVGDKTFYREDVSKQERSDIRGYQAYFVTIARGYALSLIISTENPEETQKLAENLAALHFGSNLAVMESQTKSADRRARTMSPQESGSFNSGIYHNSYFGITYRVPMDWYVDTNIFKTRIGASTGHESDPAKRNFMLLAATEFAPGTPGVGFNSSLAVMADLTAPYPRPLTGKDYLPSVTSGLVSKYHAELIQQGTEIVVGEHKFYRADYRRPPLSYQAVVCTVWKGYVFTWTFVARSSSELDKLVTSLRHITFQDEVH